MLSNREKILQRWFMRTVVSVGLLFSFLNWANAQGGVGSTRGLPDSGGGLHHISGRVYLPDGRRAGSGILVKLDGNVTGTRRASTDSDGAFIFNSLPASSYQLTVDGGSDYAPFKQTVVIYGGDSLAGVTQAQTVSVDIHLLPVGGVDAKAFQGVPQSAVEKYKAGARAAQSGDSKKAIENLNAAVTIHPTFMLALSDLGDLYRKVGDMEKLAQTMESLLKISPKDAHAHLNLGIAMYNLKKFPEAETHLKEAIELNNADPVAHYYFGMTLLSTKRYPEAEAELEMTIKNGGDNLALAHKYLGGLYMSSKKNKEAADELEKYLKLDPKAADADRIKGTIKELRSSH